ncbi:MAG TPA: argininosuccinate lyase [Sedimentisphaerales bacterium]|nr:argininosuccinate lyase [Sedimentisphaerales bacterium]
MTKQEKSWEKRLKGKTDELAVDFVESLSYDVRLYKYDIRGSIAHAKMLSEQGLITKSEFGQIKQGLLQISEQIESGEFKFDKTQEDIHMAVEAALVELIGDAGKKLHTGRSRNDQVATDIRLWMRDEIVVLQGKIKKLQAAFVKLAGCYAENIMPSYTHMQRAQPIVIGAYLLSFVEQLERDSVRLCNCSRGLNFSPLGSGAVAGSTIAINRKSTADELGFDGVTANSIDSVSDRDFCAEFIFDCSLLAAHLSRLAEDWIIYSTNEFNFIKISDSYCTSSSMMPQKRNPDMLELIRAKTGSIYGALIAMLTILKALPSGYNRDLQEDKLHVFKSADTAAACVDMAEAIVSNTKFNCSEIETGIDSGFLDATGLAEYLVGKSVPFRQAHGVVGSLVAYCEGAGKKLSDLSIDEFRKYCNNIGDDVYKSLGAVNVAGNYVTEGAGSAEQSKKRINYWNRRLGKK